MKSTAVPWPPQMKIASTELKSTSEILMEWQSFPMAVASCMNSLAGAVKNPSARDAESMGIGPPAGEEMMVSYPAVWNV